MPHTWKIALELYDQALKNGIHFDWMTFDERYSSKPDFLRGLTTRKQKFVGKVPRSFTGWLKPPRIITRPYHKNRRGRGRKIPQLLERTAEEIARTQRRNAAARKGHIKATRKKLRASGIKLNEVPRCTWGKT